MDLEKLKESLENLSDKELFRHLRLLICQSLDQLDHPSPEINATLDIVFSECQRRGKERLYDKTFETISTHPEMCKTSWGFLSLTFNL